MILDNEQKLAFIHIPRCAGSNLKTRLLDHKRFTLYNPDIDTISDDYKSKYLIGLEEVFLEKNSTIEAITLPIDHLPAKYTPEGYTSVVFIKNTFHREVSQYSMLSHHQETYFEKCFFTDFKSFLKFKYLTDPDTPFVQMNTGLLRKRGCYEYCYEEDILIADYIHKIEDISTIWPHFSSRFNLPLDLWYTTSNVHTQGNWRDYYDQECIDIVTKFRKKDLDTFGYTFA